MIQKKIINFVLILLCYMLCFQVDNGIAARVTFNDDVMVVEGESVKSSEIKYMLADWNVSKIYIYLTHTFHVDVDLKLNGIKELQIFANTWNITQPVSFDISGLDGRRQALPKIKGSGGNDGIAGMDGGNFFGLANKTINGDYLTVMSNGGDGGDGQDGSASNDLYVLLNVAEDTDTSGWFSNGDLQNYYKKYFDDRGYDTEIIGYDDDTSLYAVFVHNKKASLNVRLHPQKCCGTTGIGGSGGHGGKRGKFTFKHVGPGYNISEDTPFFIALRDGTMGKSGYNADTCDTFALDVRIDAELKKVVFIILPVHHSVSSTFTMLNHTMSSKCLTAVYVRTNETIISSMSSEIDTVSSVIRYKRFLIENMKNASVAHHAQQMYKVIDENPELNSEISIIGLLLEACQLERNYADLKNSISVIYPYRRLWKRVKSLNTKGLTQDERNARSNLRSILDVKLLDIFKSYDIPLNIKETIKSIERRRYRIPTSQNIDDVDLQNKINQFRYAVNENHIVAEFHDTIEKFTLTYFPFSVDYLDEFHIPTYIDDLDELISAATTKLNRLSQIVENIKSSSVGITHLHYDNDTNPKNALYIWKGADVRDEIGKLFEGKKIKLLADVNQSQKKFNAYKFNTLELVFRSTNQTVNSQLNDVLKGFELDLDHNGVSAFRCNNHIYQLKSEPLYISSSFKKDESQLPLSRSKAYDELRLNEPMLSPFTLWEIQLGKYHRRNIDDSNYAELTEFGQFDFDIEMHGFGYHLQEDVPICENENLEKYFGKT